MENNLLKEQGIDGRIIPKLIWKTWDGMVWTVVIWLRAGTNSRFLWTH
jgi:hypothetical protein